MTQPNRKVLMTLYVLGGVAVLMNLGLVVLQYHLQGKFSWASVTSALAAGLLIVSLVFSARARRAQSEPKEGEGV